MTAPALAPRRSVSLSVLVKPSLEGRKRGATKPWALKALPSVPALGLREGRLLCPHREGLMQAGRAAIALGSPQR